MIVEVTTSLKLLLRCEQILDRTFTVTADQRFFRPKNESVVSNNAWDYGALWWPAIRALISGAR
jgi:hypothetical protein